VITHLYPLCKYKPVFATFLTTNIAKTGRFKQK